MRDALQSDRPLFLHDLGNAATLWAKLESVLTAGAVDPQHGFHWPSLATVDAQCEPSSRIVVLRKFDSADRTLFIHSDGRAAKIDQLKLSGKAALLFYDPAPRLQLRVLATVTIHQNDEVARNQFDALPAHTKASYASTQIPGTQLDIHAPFDFPPKPPVNESTAFAHFAVIACHIHTVEALELHATGHRRISLTHHSDGHWVLVRLAP